MKEDCLQMLNNKKIILKLIQLIKLYYANLFYAKIFLKMNKQLR